MLLLGKSKFCVTLWVAEINNLKQKKEKYKAREGEAQLFY
jgi:hypothetical protein